MDRIHKLIYLIHKLEISREKSLLIEINKLIDELESESVNINIYKSMVNEIQVEV